MNIKMLKAALVGLVLTVSGFASANWIDIADANGQGFFLDDVTGLTWMDTDALVNMSVHDMQIELLGTGFELATLAQITTMSENRGTTDWYADGGGDIIGTTTGNATWGYSFESLANPEGPFAVSFVWDDGNIHSGQLENPASHIGIFAVQTQTNTHNDIPEPSTLAIFALGIMGLAARRSLLVNKKQ